MSMTRVSSPVRTMFESPPPPGEWREVAAGVFWARVALPFRLNHVNVYLIDDGDAWNILDTGIPVPRGFLLKKVVRKKHGLMKQRTGNATPAPPPPPHRTPP